MSIHVLTLVQIGFRLFFMINFVDGFLTNSIVTDGHMLNGYQFWSSRVKDTVECARVCLRRAQCVSFNYDTQHGRCELNSEVSQDRVPLTIREHVVYSGISKWPSQIEPHCYSRPCQNDETCIPAGASSFTCFKLYKRCSVPEGLVTHAPRTANTVMNATCTAGYRGGVTATCLENLEWDKSVATTCSPVYEAPCEDNFDCTAINGECTGNQCLCRTGHVYDTTTDICRTVVLGLGSPCSVNTDCAVINGECTGHQCLCGTGLVYNDTTDTCQPVVLGSPCAVNTDCAVINGECTGNQCLCGAGLVYNDTTATCQPVVLGSPCAVNTDCAVINGECTGHQCLCGTGLVYNDTTDTCQPVVLGSPCAVNTDCAVINGECTGNQCLCGTGHVYNETLAICQPVVLGSPCSVNTDCAVINGECTGHQCLCCAGLVYNDTTDTCQPVVLGSPCEVNTDCAVINGECTGHQCLCGTGLVYNDTTDTCQPVVLGSPCAVITDCAVINGECTGQQCLCGTGLVYNDTTVTCQTVVLGSPCAVNTDCAVINGECTGNQCLCGAGLVYNDTTATCQTGTCPGGWMSYENHCYFFGADYVTYTQAREFCINEGSALVQVDSAAEGDALKEIMRTTTPLPLTGYWNDLYEVTDNGAERWRTTNDSLDSNVSDWCEGNPDDTFGVKQKCTMFFMACDFKWYDIECEENSYRLGYTLCKQTLT